MMVWGEAWLPVVAGLDFHSVLPGFGSCLHGFCLGLVPLSRSVAASVCLPSIFASWISTTLGHLVHSFWYVSDRGGLKPWAVRSI